MPNPNEQSDAVNQADAIRKRFTDDKKEVAAIKERAREEYRHEPGEQYTPMLRDVRFLLGQLNVVDGFWESAEKELNDVRECDKCDLCEDHYA